MFEIGIITKAQGIRGEFRVLPTTDDPTRFEKLIGDEIIINGVPQKLVNARYQKGIVILLLEEITDRNAAEKLIGAKICIPDEKALPLEDGEYYVRDLIGLCAETESGENLGELTRILQTSANDIYVITPQDGKSFMIPAVKDVVKKVDMPSGKIIINLLEGLRELTIGNL